MFGDAHLFDSDLQIYKIEQSIKLLQNLLPKTKILPVSQK